MSAAAKRDRCNHFYEPAIGTIRLEYHVTENVEKDGNTEQSWEADLCPTCSRQFLSFVNNEHPNSISNG